MNEIADRYRRLSARFADRITAVPSDRWDRPTPCEGWDARQLVDHVVGAQSRFRVRAGLGPIVTPSVADDPAAAWDTARGVVQADLDDPERANATFDGLLGRSTFAEAVDRFLHFDLIVHCWDLARAVGQDERIPPEDIAHVRAQLAVLGDRIYTSGQFAPALEPPPDADDQTRLLALLGRRV